MSPPDGIDVHVCGLGGGEFDGMSGMGLCRELKLESCKIVFIIMGHFLRTCSDLFAVECIV